MTALTDAMKAATAERAKDADVIENRRQIADQRRDGMPTGTTTLGDAIVKARREGLREAVDEAEAALKDAKRELRRLKRDDASSASIGAADEAVANAEAAVTDAARQRRAGR